MSAQTTKTIEGLIAKSVPFLLLEFRGGKPEQIKYTDKKSGKQAAFEQMVVACETIEENSRQLTVKMELNEEQKKNGWQSAVLPFKKGQRVLVVLRSYAESFGKAEAAAMSMIAAD